MHVYTADSIRAAEAPLLTSLPEGELMRRASYGLALHAVKEIRRIKGNVYGSHVVLIVGAGNNGGDTLWAGTYLRRKGAAVTAILLNPERTHKAGLTAFRAAYGNVISFSDTAVSGNVENADLVSAIKTADLALEGIVGIGGHGPLRESAAAIINALEEASVPIMSVDIPAGIDPDTGVRHHPHVHPMATVTFGALKPCRILAGPYCGRVSLVDIGLDLNAETPAMQVLSDEDVAAQWPIPGSTDNKYTTGVVGICAGSHKYPGAALLSVAGATHASSAMVRYAGSATDLVLFHQPDTICVTSPKHAGHVNAWAVGPGIGTDENAYKRLRWILKQDVPVVVDADAITLISRFPELMDYRPEGAATLVTPHTGEFLRLCSAYSAASQYLLPQSTTDIEQMGCSAAVTACREAWKNQGINLSILLKGRATYIAGSEGIYAEDTGSSWAATPGSGDVLTGIVGALVAHGAVAGRSVEESAAMAVRVHSRAALLASLGASFGESAGKTWPADGARRFLSDTDTAGRGAPVTASEISQSISAAIRDVRNGTL